MLFCQYYVFSLSRFIIIPNFCYKTVKLIKYNFQYSISILEHFFYFIITDLKLLSSYFIWFHQLISYFLWTLRSYMIIDISNWIIYIRFKLQFVLNFLCIFFIAQVKNTRNIQCNWMVILELIICDHRR